MMINRRIRRAGFMVLLLLLIMSSAGSGFARTPHNRYGGAPFAFEPNYGQASSDVAFVARGRSLSIALSRDHTVLALRSGERHVHLGIRPVGARIVQPRGENVLKGYSNYLVGNAPTDWKAGLPRFAEVRYSNLYDGIDLKYYGRDNTLEYDFIIRPGANPGVIRLRFEGSQGLRVAPSGDLLIALPGGVMRHTRPLAYQLHDNQQVRVPARYRLLGRNDVSFELGEWDRTTTLVIDPILVYGSYIGGTNTETAEVIARDRAGNVYIAGATDSIVFPGMNGVQTTFMGTQDAYVAKLNATGDLVYATYLGGAGLDAARAITIDAAGNAYVAGETTSGNFPITGSAAKSTLTGVADAFIVKLNPTGSGLVFSTYAGGSFIDYASSVVLDVGGNVFIAGTTESLDLPVAVVPPHGALDGFVMKLSAAGDAVVWSTYVGGSGLDIIYALAITSGGDLVVAGHSESTNITGSIPQQPTNAGLQDGFVARLNNAGLTQTWAWLGGSGLDSIRGMALDRSDAIYVTGETRSTNFPATSALQPSFGGGVSDGFVAKLNAAATQRLYSTYIGGTGDDFGRGIAIDSLGTAFITGATTGSTGFPLVNAIKSSVTGSADAFAIRVAPDGSTLVYSTLLGGNSTDTGWGIAIDGEANAYVAGLTSSAEWFPGKTARAQDGFVIKLGTGTMGCVYTASSLRSIASEVGGVGSFTVTVTGGVCPWSIGVEPISSEDVSWLQLTSSISGNGSTTVTYTVSPSVQGVVRAALISVAGARHMVIQGQNEADSNSDNRADLIWQDPTNGFTQFWYLNHLYQPGDTFNLTLSNPWRIAGIADFNLDGKPDVLWQNPATGASQVWLLGGLNGTHLLEAVGINGSMASWRIAATGDFNSDGWTDIVWQNSANGESQIWLMGGHQGTTVIGATGFTGPNSWRIVGAADFNRDGRTDIVWQDPATAYIQVWYLGGATGTTITNASVLTSGNTWTIARIMDLNKDGFADLIWQDPITGVSQAWFMNGSLGTTLTNAVNVSGSNPWRIAPLRF